MKKKIFLSALAIIVVSLFLVKQINICNFSSLDQFKYSLKVFGKNPYISCAGDITPYIVKISRKLKTFYSSLTSRETILQIEEIEPIHLRTGQEIYQKACAACHADGFNGAPVFGKQQQWKKLAEKGIDNLVYATKNGLNGMPPMGLCNDCSNEELELAVAYLVNGKDLTANLTNKESLITLSQFDVNSPLLLAGQKIEYQNEGYSKNKSDQWNRSHGNNANTKFFRTNRALNDKETNLEIKWTYDFFDVQSDEKFYKYNIQVNPVFYKGSLFVLGPDFRFISFDAASGKINWELVLPPILSMVPKRGILVEDDKVFLNIGEKLFVFHYLTGKVSDSFGSNGVFSGGSLLAPFIFNQHVFIVSLDGYVRGFDTESGELVSEIAYRNENLPGYSSRPWGGVALDDITGHAYFSTGNPKPGLIGVSRPGSNKGSNTLFAINLVNENIAWTFQETQHDVWDLDLPSPPILANLKTSNGKELRVVISISKTGNIFIFDRLTGKNLHNIEWVSVNTDTDIPGENLSPVQINSTLPERLINIEYRKEDYSLGSPEEVEEIKKFLEKSNLGFYPPHTIGRSSVMYGLHGGGEWPGSSLNEITGEMYTPANQIPWKIRIQGRTNKSFEDLPGDFQSKWKNEYRQYIQNCSQCHAADRQGNVTVIGEKEVSYNPSLVGLFLKDKLNTSIFENSFFTTHLDLNEQINLKNMLSFHGEWDQALNRQDSIWFQGVWSRLLTKEGNIATDLPYGKVVSSNPLTGRINWETLVGETKIFNSIRKGKSMFGGVASSDDGLLYVTGSNDGKLYILDQVSGNILYSKQLIASGSTPPTIFSVDKKTNVAVLSTGGIYHNNQKKGASLYVFEH